MMSDPAATLQALADWCRKQTEYAELPRARPFWTAMAEQVETIKGLIDHDFEHVDLPVIVASALAVAAAAGVTP